MIPLDAHRLIFAPSHEAYLEHTRWVYHRDSQCTHITQLSDILGYHKQSNPNIMLIFLDRFWEGPVGDQLDRIAELVAEFEDRSYYTGHAKTIIDLVRLESIRDVGELPKYLSCDSRVVRKAAARKLEELEG